MEIDYVDWLFSFKNLSDAEPQIEQSSMEIDDVEIIPDWLFSINLPIEYAQVQIEKSRITINEKPKPNFLALAQKPDIRKVSPIPEYAEIQFITGNIDEFIHEKDNIRFTSSPNAKYRTAEYRKPIGDVSLIYVPSSDTQNEKSPKKS